MVWLRVVEQFVAAEGRSGSDISCWLTEMCMNSLVQEDRQKAQVSTIAYMNRFGAAWK